MKNSSYITMFILKMRVPILTVIILDFHLVARIMELKLKNNGPVESICRYALD